MENFEDENPKNIYVIRRKLATLKKCGANWELKIGIFSITISPETGNWSQFGSSDDSVLKHEKLRVDLYEEDARSPHLRQYVYLHSDPRFMNYKPIQYNIIETPTGGRINLSNGHDMPILHLCELIRYLYRLSNLTVFT